MIIASLCNAVFLFCVGYELNGSFHVHINLQFVLFHSWLILIKREMGTERLSIFWRKRISKVSCHWFHSKLTIIFFKFYQICNSMCFSVLLNFLPDATLVSFTTQDVLAKVLTKAYAKILSFLFNFSIICFWMFIMLTILTGLYLNYEILDKLSTKVVCILVKLSCIWIIILL